MRCRNQRSPRSEQVVDKVPCLLLLAWNVFVPVCLPADPVLMRTVVLGEMS